jgi:hypothetical protein
MVRLRWWRERRRAGVTTTLLRRRARGEGSPEEEEGVGVNEEKFTLMPLFITEGDWSWRAVNFPTSWAVTATQCHVEEEGGVVVPKTVPQCARCQ